MSKFPIRGGCLCEGVRFTVNRQPRNLSGCHCGQCRKTSGSYAPSMECPADSVVFETDASLAWFRSSEFAERGFCRLCGSRLFWRADGDPMLWVAVGALDGETGLSIDRHIYVADKPDWYEIDDGKPQHRRLDDEAPIVEGTNSG